MVGDQPETWLGEPMFWFVKDTGSPSAHHLDYTRLEFDRALCGRSFVEPQWEGAERPSRVCRKCQDRLPEHEARQWQLRASLEMDLRKAAELQLAELEAAHLAAEHASVGAQADHLQIALNRVAENETPLHWYVLDQGSSAAHQLDYERTTTDHGLCGRPFADILWQGENRPRRVCRACQSRLDVHEKAWWRRRAAAERSLRISADQERADADDRSRALLERVRNQTAELGRLNARIQKLNTDGKNAGSKRPEKKTSLGRPGSKQNGSRSLVKSAPE